MIVLHFIQGIYSNGLWFNLCLQSPPFSFFSLSSILDHCTKHSLSAVRLWIFFSGFLDSIAWTIIRYQSCLNRTLSDKLLRSSILSVYPSLCISFRQYPKRIDLCCQSALFHQGRLFMCAFIAYRSFFQATSVASIHHFWSTFTII